MGTSKRYADHYDRLMDTRTLQRIAGEYSLQALTDKELRRGTLPLTTDSNPKPCTAWVRLGPHAMQVSAVVVMWNDIACGIQFAAGERTVRCWVWANAVTPTGSAQTPPPPP